MNHLWFIFRYDASIEELERKRDYPSPVKEKEIRKDKSRREHNSSIVHERMDLPNSSTHVSKTANQNEWENTRNIPHRDSKMENDSYDKNKSIQIPKVEEKHVPKKEEKRKSRKDKDALEAEEGPKVIGRCRNLSGVSIEDNPNQPSNRISSMIYRDEEGESEAFGCRALTKKEIEVQEKLLALEDQRKEKKQNENIRPGKLGYINTKTNPRSILDKSYESKKESENPVYKSDQNISKDNCRKDDNFSETIKTENYYSKEEVWSCASTPKISEKNQSKFKFDTLFPYTSLI